MKPCGFPGCAALVRPPANYCPGHQRAAGARERARRGSAAERGYDARWRAYRAAFLRQYPLCGMRPAGAERRIALGGIEWSECKHAGRTRAADLVDHIAPHRGDAALFWDGANHQALCFSCGNAKSGKGM